MLSLDRALKPLPADTTPVRDLAQNIRHWIEETDFVVDLGSRIGSRDWCRGAAICFALCASAWSLRPDFAPLPGAQSATLPEVQWQEERALSFSPLAYGADTGRRMAATEAVELLEDTPERPRIELTATLGQGDGFIRSLERAGVSDAEAKTVGDLVASAVPLGSIDAGTRMDIVMGRRANKHEARPLQEIKFRARLDLALAVERPETGGALRLRRMPIAVDDTPLRIQGRVGSGLYVAARGAGAPASAVQTYLRALAGHLSIARDIKASDQFDLVIAQRRAETGEVEIGDLLYGGLDQGKRKVRLLKWTTGGRTEWFEASGVGQSRGAFQRPVAGARLTSSFGMRLHPLLGYTRFHRGVDYGAAMGTPIVAVTDGVVSFSGWHGGHGNFVQIKHGGGLATGYGHMSRIAAHVGERVRQGEVIGYVGSTGMSTGPHLHFEVYRNQIAVNPTSVSFVTQAQLTGAELQKFRSTLANYLAVRPGASPTFARKTEKQPEAKTATVEVPKKDAKKRG
jgi:murein DD-endopeptidase MepM/ murein hydrolase activator NlpD